MKQFLILAVIAAFVFACGNNTNNQQTSTESTPAASEPATASAEGEKLYKQYCVTCHGVYGDMGASGAFNLTTSTLSDEERVAVISEGRPNTVMVGFKTILKEDQIKAVAEYTKSLKQ